MVQVSCVCPRDTGLGIREILGDVTPILGLFLISRIR